MSAVDLFPPNQIIGVFRGFREGGLEFHADLLLPYRNEFQSSPMHGQFLLVQLESKDEAVLGRISSFSSEGKLASSSGEEYNIRAMQEDRSVPEDLREQYLRYRVNIRVLGVLRNQERLTFVPSHRRLPHVGSKVAFASDEVLREIAGHNGGGAEIGHFALGEYIYAGNSTQLDIADWMQIKYPEVLIKFPIDSLVSRRSFIFARAGFGKSNLNKLLFSKLYEKTPTVIKRGGKPVPVGTIIFDPDGEYFWPDDKGRPGLCDVPQLQNQLVVFTSRKAPSEFYQSFVAGGIRLDIRQLRPADVIGIALSPERQEQQNVKKLKGLNREQWERMVNLIDELGNQADLQEIGDILHLENKQQDVEALAARSNMTEIVRSLHDKNSQLWEMLVYALSAGKLCIIDVSQMRGKQSLILSGLILRKIFDRNQQEFTAAEPKTIPTIAVVEEAQSVLNDGSAGAEPYIAWVKEGRKYDLGALLITQQPGSIPVDILSQGDNWFVFHLLSSTDLVSLHRANAHFSDDLLSSLLNEPIPGQGVFWSSVSGQPYPISIRALSFEGMHKILDPKYDRQALVTFASTLKSKFDTTIKQLVGAENNRTTSANQNTTISPQKIHDLPMFTTNEETNLEPSDPIDVLELIRKSAIESLSERTDIIGQMRNGGIPWGTVQKVLHDSLPDTIPDRWQYAYELLPKVMNELFGKGNWQTRKNPNNKAVIFVNNSN